MQRAFVDTNYIIRFLLKDEQRQFEIVSNYFTQSVVDGKLLVSNNIVIFEVYWVLLKVFKTPVNELNDLIFNFIQLDFIELEDANIILDALRLNSGNKLGLEDNFHMVYAKNKQVDEFATFDKKLAATWKTYQLI